MRGQGKLSKIQLACTHRSMQESRCYTPRIDEDDEVDAVLQYRLTIWPDCEGFQGPGLKLLGA